MKLKWIVETSNLDHQNNQHLIEVLKGKGYEVFEIKYIPFDPDPLKTPFKEDDCVVVFGSINLLKKINRQHKWVPGTLCNFEELKCSSYYPKMYDKMFNQKICFFPFGLLKNNYFFDRIMERFTDLYDGKLFIRPDDNEKSFDGQLIDRKGLDEFLKISSCYSTEDNLMVMVAEAEIDYINDEYRFIAVDDKIVAGSRYRLDGALSISPKIPEPTLFFANYILETIKGLPKVFCLDVCRNQFNEPSVLEIGALTAAGLYACDLSKMVDAVAEYALKEYNEYN